MQSKKFSDLDKVYHNAVNMEIASRLMVELEEDIQRCSIVSNYYIVVRITYFLDLSNKSDLLSEIKLLSSVLGNICLYTRTKSMCSTIYLV